MLDDRTIGRYGPDWPARKFLVWDENSNKIGWSAYVGEDKAGKDSADVSIYAAPGRARAEDLVGLPRTYIDTPGLDLFRDEDLRYAQTLSRLSFTYTLVCRMFLRSRYLLRWGW